MAIPHWPALPFPRRSLLVIGTALLARPAGAAPPLPGDRERAWDAMQRAPIHLQAEMVARPAFRFGGYTSAVGEAVVRHVFRGQGSLAVGQRFRFRVAVQEGDWYLRPGVPPMAMPTDPPFFLVPRDALAQGRMAELILAPADHAPPDGYHVVSAGFRAIEAIGGPPRIDPRERPPWYDMRHHRGEADPEPARPRQRLQPPDFPQRDVALDYVATRGGVREEVSAVYHAESWRMRVTPRGSQAASRGDLLLDGFGGVLTRLWERDRTFALRPGGSRERYGHALHYFSAGAPARMGEAVIAGLSCVEWRIAEGSRETRSWLTADGVQLRRIEPGLTIEVTRAEFRPVPVERVRVPMDWRRVPEDGPPED